MNIIKSTTESGRLRWRFGRNIVIQRRVQFIDTLYPFSSSIHLIGKCLFSLSTCILFLQNIILNRQHDPFFRRLTNLTFFLKHLWRFEMCSGSIFKKNSNNEEMTKRLKNLFFLFYFWFGNILSPNIRVFPLYNTIKLAVSTWIYIEISERVSVRTWSNYLHRLRINVSVYLKYFFDFCFR